MIHEEEDKTRGKIATIKNQYDEPTAEKLIKKEENALQKKIKKLMNTYDKAVKGIDILKGSNIPDDMATSIGEATSMHNSFYNKDLINELTPKPSPQKNKETDGKKSIKAMVFDRNDDEMNDMLKKLQDYDKDRKSLKEEKNNQPKKDETPPTRSPMDTQNEFMKTPVEHEDPY